MRTSSHQHAVSILEILEKRVQQASKEQSLGSRRTGGLEKIKQGESLYLSMENVRVIDG